MLDIIPAIEKFLTEESALRAVVFALAMSWGGTQWFKHRKAVKTLDSQTYRITVQAVAFTFAWVPVARLWPGETDERFLAAGVTAVCAPFTYTLIARVAYHFFPWLEQKMSAQPKPKDGDA